MKQLALGGILVVNTLMATPLAGGASPPRPDSSRQIGLFRFASFQVPIGGQPLRPPTPAEVCRCLPQPNRWAAAQVTIERVVDKLHPPCFYPLVGRARLHQVTYKCMVKRAGAQEILYLDRHQLRPLR